MTPEQKLREAAEHAIHNHDVIVEGPKAMQALHDLIDGTEIIALLDELREWRKLSACPSPEAMADGIRQLYDRWQAALQPSQGDEK